LSIIFKIFKNFILINLYIEDNFLTLGFDKLLSELIELIIRQRLLISAIVKPIQFKLNLFISSYSLNLSVDVYLTNLDF